MSNKFRVWLRVTPSPTTLAESSAIHKQLKSQGQVQGFARASRADLLLKASEDADSTFYHATFVHEPLHLQKSFNVTAYSDVIDPKEADPYNIRGLQNRKPYPVPKTFTCSLEKIEEDHAKERNSQSGSLWRGHFIAKKNDWFQTVLEETGAPPGIARGLSAAKNIRVRQDAESELLGKSHPKSKKIQMDSLMKPWHKALNSYTSAHDNRSSQGRLATSVQNQEGRDTK